MYITSPILYFTKPSLFKSVKKDTREYRIETFSA